MLVKFSSPVLFTVRHKRAARRTPLAAVAAGRQITKRVLPDGRVRNAGESGEDKSVGQLVQLVEPLRSVKRLPVSAHYWEVSAHHRVEVLVWFHRQHPDLNPDDYEIELRRG